MQRRGWTVAVGAAVVAALTWLVLWVDVPYVAYLPGPTVDTLRTDDGKASGDEIIDVKGATETGSEGQFRMTTVSLVDRPRLAEALWYWFSDDYAVVPREFVFPPDKTEKEVERESREQFATSQASAETAALRKLGCPVRVTVTGFTASSPLAGRLRAGDVVQAVDGSPVTSLARLQSLLTGDKERKRRLTYLRDGRAGAVTVAPGESPDRLLGLRVEQRQPCRYDVRFDRDVQEIGGPSAGLIFAVAIVDKVLAEDLTGGRVIAGTGEINDEGDVGAIGGVPQKLRAAKRDGAEVFLTPEENCADAVANDPGGLLLVRVGDLDDALRALRTLREGGQPPLCRA